MSLRITRVNELIKREIANYLSQKYRAEAVRWTITSVETSPDLRNATVAYSVIGDDKNAREAQLFFRKHAGDLRKEVTRFVILTYSPRLQFVRDFGIERGNRVMEILDDLEDQGSMGDTPNESQ